MNFSPRKIIGRAVFALGEAVFPRRCGHCEEFIQERDWLCLGCRKQLDELVGKPFCDRCAAPLAMENAPCPFCQGKGLFPLGSVARLGVFDEPLRKLIHQLKYKKLHAMADRLGEELSKKNPVKIIVQECDVVIPVPLHWRRHWARGFNQSDLLAAALGRGFGKKTRGVIKRIRNTPTQTLMTSQEDRRQNVKGAFRLSSNPRMLAGKRIVLVDDVMTTGATIQEAARVLMEGAPARIDVVVLAAADPKNRGFSRI